MASTAPIPRCSPACPSSCVGTKVIRLDENHRCTPQVVAVATAVLREGGSFSGDGEVVPPRTTRVDGPVPQVIAHATDDDEAIWAARGQRCPALPVVAGRASPCSPAPTPNWPRCKAAMDAARVPSRIAGSDLGPASDLRGAADGRRGVTLTRDADVDAATGTRSPRTRPPGTTSC